MKTRYASALIAALPLLAACEPEPDPFAAPAPPTVAVRSFPSDAPGTAERNLPGGYGMKIYRVTATGSDTTVVLHSAIHVAS